MTLGPNLKSILSDERGRLSHKRVIALMLSLSLMVTFIISAITKVQLDKDLISAIEFIIIAVVGATTADKFSNRASGASQGASEPVEDEN
jgi:hypothetical protein